ncbi:bifunctional transcriptional activator/DNA repair enzyme AdaA [Celerinatantimonas diazotrophica]|uniref:methylated-DNA--[protein]-cysteine S-methyltransferase n=1 Tax=Celerinatantimonas diazotrophica TaxID=412034 RepID=A0A4R1JBI9_9GAMM|nr:methylated-DNA--[protein]-cysteine S-methyltransferase [Celerinatantimonas diazotrophica]TCK47509.1 AraC family transcriptional regulator of adaptative response/methylated-DNA-[protein]-cysteine methyltransferase [Celerinatantimonas diazotrophica]CAG9296873.1 Bifunctional transcriptional activator/DNA repair enzyme Ada [Celerinatantimonas diazotrophica]
MPKLSDNEMKNAVAQRDGSFDGHFYYGVITTGVFCSPSCSTKAANPENLRFFFDIESAMQAGYRPCKRCNPAGQDTRTQQLIDVARYIETHAEDKMTLTQLGNIAGVSPSRLQRSFKDMFGVSPKHYQDAVRMRKFKRSLKEGESVTDAIYSSGYGSISRIYGEATRNIGMTPKVYRAGGKGEIIHYACRETALGLMIMAATDKGVCSVQFGDDKDSLLTLLGDEFPEARLVLSAAQDAPELDSWMLALDQHISQGAPRPDVPLDIRGTAFQIKVWQFLLSIKEGDVMSYGEVAAHIDNPKAVRAVGAACGKNPVGILIPCHRVLRSDGSLGGYRWGLERKRTLLDMERARR